MTDFTAVYESLDLFTLKFDYWYLTIFTIRVFYCLLDSYNIQPNQLD